MGQIYDLGENRKLLLYALNHHIYLRTLLPGTVSRPLALCSDHLRDLSSIVYHDTLYYAYVNEAHQLLLRSINENTVLFRQNCELSEEFYRPQPVRFCDRLLLFYLCKKEEQTYCVRCILPFQEELGSSVEDRFSSLPDYQILAADHSVFLCLNDGAHEKLWIMNRNFEWTEPEDTSATIAELQQTVKENESLIDSLSVQLSKADAKFSSLEQELAARNAMIESARQQYEALMDVANQYREEAIKWRSKLSVT